MGEGRVVKAGEGRGMKDACEGKEARDGGREREGRGTKEGA